MGLFDHIAPELGLRLDEGCGLGRAAAGGVQVDLGETRLDGGLVQHLVDRLVELGDDRLRRLGRGADGVPVAGLEALQSQFIERGDVRQVWNPLQRRHRQDARLAPLMQLDRLGAAGHVVMFPAIAELDRHRVVAVFVDRLLQLRRRDTGVVNGARVIQIGEPARQQVRSGGR